MIGIVVILLICGYVAPCCAVVYLWRSQRRCYNYAVTHSDFTERGCAYSDMATVIALDGKVGEQ